MRLSASLADAFCLSDLNDLSNSRGKMPKSKRSELRAHLVEVQTEGDLRPLAREIERESGEWTQAAQPE